VKLALIPPDKLWQELWKHSVAGLAVLDDEGRFLSGNPAFCRIVEYAEAELKTKTWKDITHPEDITADEAMANDLAADKVDAYDMVKRYITKTNTVRWVQLRVSRIALDDGTFAMFLSQITPHFPATSAIAMPVYHRVRMIDYLRQNWPMIAAVLSAVAIIVAGVLERVFK
jgi:PAS domain S-box-containing protein